MHISEGTVDSVPSASQGDGLLRGDEATHWGDCVWDGDGTGLIAHFMTLRAQREVKVGGRGRGGCLQDGKLSDVRRMGAGFAAGITEALVIVTPFEVVKIRLQQQRGMSKELLKYRVRPGPDPRTAPASTPGMQILLHS